MRKLKHLLPVGALLCLSSLSLATTTLVTSRAALGGNDFIDWGVLGPAFTSVANPFTVTSNGGQTLSVSKPDSGNFEIRVQGAFPGDFSGGWHGDFNPGDSVLWTGTLFDFNNNPTTIVNFSAPGISAGGAQIQPDEFGNFTAKIEAFDASNNSLGSWTENGVSTDTADNSAIFIGINSTTPISKIAFSISASDVGTIGDYGINRFDFKAVQAQTVYLDIKPGSCPNAFNLKSNGTLPVAILGTSTFNVQNIVLSSLKINGISPLKSQILDVATPFTGALNDCKSCNTSGPDGIPDLLLNFDSKKIASSLNTTLGACVPVTITGKLIDGTMIQGKDFLNIVNQ